MKKIKWLNLIFSIVLSISFNLKYVIDDNLNFFIERFYVNAFFVFKVFILSIFIYFVLELLFLLLDCFKIREIHIDLTLKYKILIFIGIFISSFIFLIVHYPAVYLNDSLFIMYNPIALSQIHPLFYGIGMSLCFIIFKILFGASLSVFVMSLIQTIISSAILTYVICWFHGKHHYNYLTVILIFYYILFPIVSNYNVALNKDTPFSLSFLVFFTLVYEYVETKGCILSSKKYLIRLVLVSFFMIYTRNNGVYIIIFSFLILFMIYGFRRYSLKCISFLVIVFMISLLPFGIMKKCHIEYWQREKYSIPLQQIGYVVKYHPDSFDISEYQLLSKFIKDSKKTLQENYHIFEVDEIKFHENFDSIKFNEYEMDFFHLWLNHLSSDFTSYVKSYLLNTYDLWSINPLKKNQSVIDKASVAVFDDYNGEIIYNQRIFPKSIQSFFRKYYQLFNTYCNPASCFIILLIINIYSFTKKRKDCFFISIPLILLWVILMLSTPLASALRYMAPYIYILPIIVLNTIYYTREENVL